MIKILILGVSTMSLAQKNWDSKFNGAVVTKDNSVITGYLTFGDIYKDKGTKVSLLKRPGDTPQIFYTLELKGYVYKQDTFRTIYNLQPYLDDSKVIEIAEARIAQNGKLTLYEIPEEYYIHTYGYGALGAMTPMVISKKKYLYIILDTRREMIGVKKENFEEVMQELLIDTPDILGKVEYKIFKFKDLNRIIREYNQRFQ